MRSVLVGTADRIAKAKLVRGRLRHDIGSDRDVVTADLILHASPHVLIVVAALVRCLRRSSKKPLY